MPRFVFRRKTGISGKAVSELAGQAAALGATVLSQSGTMLYIEGSRHTFEQLSATSPDYLSVPETRAKLPEPPRVRITKAPRK